jgi:hypothetical protein
MSALQHDSETMPIKVKFLGADWAAASRRAAARGPLSRVARLIQIGLAVALRVCCSILIMLENEDADRG